ncbi:hypothetical protein YSY43_01680 [Paenibacillus sp. YSY-4.3]
MLTTKTRRKSRTKLVKRKRRRTSLGGKRKISLRRRRRHLSRKSGSRVRHGRRLRRKKPNIPQRQAEIAPTVVPGPEPAVPLPAAPVDDPALFQQAYDVAYQEGFNSGFSKGFEDGHKLAYKNRV